MIESNVEGHVVEHAELPLLSSDHVPSLQE